MDTPEVEAARARPVEKAPRRRIAAFLVLALVLAGAMWGGVAYHQGLFGSHVPLHFVADDVTGLAPGTTVRLSGFRVGKIERLELLDDHRVKVSLTVQEEIFRRLRTDARAVVVREQLKPAAIDLKPGSATAALPRENPLLAYQRRGTLNEIADDLRTRIAPILDDLRQLSSMARERRGDLDAILLNTNQITSALATTSRQMEALAADLRQRTRGLGAQSEAAMVQANRSLVRIDGLIGQADKGLEAVNHKLPGMLEKADKTLAQLDQVLRDTRTITAATAAGLPPLLRNAPPLVEESRELLQGVRESWPVKLMLPAAPAVLLPVDSHDAAAARDARDGARRP